MNLKTLPPRPMFHSMRDNKTCRGFLVGIGLDNKDGHKRITRSEHFILAGGSEKTHASMTETAVKTMEQLNQRGKTLANVEKEELREIMENSIPR